MPSEEEAGQADLEVLEKRNTPCICQEPKRRLLGNPASGISAMSDVLSRPLKYDINERRIRVKQHAQALSL
jgi:hypothetical protein